MAERAPRIIEGEAREVMRPEPTSLMQPAIEGLRAVFETIASVEKKAEAFEQIADLYLQGEELDGLIANAKIAELKINAQGKRGAEKITEARSVLANLEGMKLETEAAIKRLVHRHKPVRRI